MSERKTTKKCVDSCMCSHDDLNHMPKVRRANFNVHAWQIAFDASNRAQDHSRNGDNESEDSSDDTSDWIARSMGISNGVTSGRTYASAVINGVETPVTTEPSNGNGQTI